jgi:2-polyprenyl-6-methoxyphenol hydroxylase-like FAD-dependent oxidoreductase
LNELGVQVDRGWELMDTKVVEEGNKSWVETTIRKAIQGTNIRTTESKVLGVVEEDAEEEGKLYQTEIVRSEYLIATDGGKSVVRHKLKIAFPGRTLDNNIIIFDGQVDSDIPFDGITQVDVHSSVVFALFSFFLFSFFSLFVPTVFEMLTPTPFLFSLLLNFFVPPS